MIIEDPRENLYVALWLHVAAHNAKSEQGFSSPGNHGWDNGVKGPFSWSNFIGVPWSQRKSMAAVLHRNAGIGNDDS